MNQILAVEDKKNNKKSKKTARSGPLEIKGIIRFFAIAIILFGLALSSEGVYAICKNVEDRKPANIPKVTISRTNDKATINVTHNVRIAKITYSWDDGEETVIPVGSTTAQEEITLLGYDSTLNLTIEDENGKQVNYQKQYLLTGEDLTKPTIEIDTQNGNDKMIITAKDETAISYLSYQWENEEEVTINRETEGQKEIRVEVDLTPGNKKITVIAEDANGNIEQKEKEIVISTSKPEISLIRDGNQIYIEARDKDGIQSIMVNINGQKMESTGINQKEVKAGPIDLQPGNNTIYIEVTNINGYTEKGATEIQYE